MKRLAMFFLGLLLFVPLSALAVEKGSETAPPIEQTLVREGDFALRLADTLSLAKTDNESDAERVLASAEIAPKNGWISDFPVTPDVLAEIRASVVDAAESGRIKMDKKIAEDRFYALSKDMELPIVAGNDTATADSNMGYVTGEEYGEAADYQDQNAINDYYYDEGPPVITYYAPPPDYFYLYAWDPYPFWWGGYWFPGYYVLNNFTIVVDNGHRGRHHRHRHDGWRERGGRGDIVSERSGRGTKLISNRVVDSDTNKVTTIDPVTRNTRTAADISRSGRSLNPTRFTNTDTRRGAENILRNSGMRERGTATIDRGDSGFTRRENRSVSRPSTDAFRRDNATRTTGRSFDPAPSMRGRSSDAGRSFDPAPSMRGRSSDVGRSFDPAPSMRGRSSNVGRSFDPAPSMRGRSSDVGRSSVGESRQFAPAGRSISSGSGGRSFSSPRAFSPAHSGGSVGSRSPGSGGGGFGRGGGFGGGGCRGGKC
jgi:hypothetical protein